MGSLLWLCLLPGFVLLAGASEENLSCKSSVNIGDHQYHPYILGNISVYNGIVVDKKSNIFFNGYCDFYVWKDKQDEPNKIDGKRTLIFK